MDADTLEELSERLDAQAALLEIMGGETIDVDLHRETAVALREALVEIRRLRSDVNLYIQKCNALEVTLAEIEHLRTDAPALAQELAMIEPLTSDVDLRGGEVGRRRSKWILRLRKSLQFGQRTI
jgi:hypothetical protein